MSIFSKARTRKTDQNHVKIGVMARSLGLRHGGVYRYVWNVLKHFDQIVADGREIEVVILHNEPELRGKC